MINKSIEYNYIPRDFRDFYSERSSILVYILMTFIFLSVLNRFQFGISLNGVIVPIILFVVVIFFTKRSFKLSRGHALIVLFWIFATLSTFKSRLVSPQRDTITFLVFCIFFILSTGINYTKNEVKLILKTYILTCVICSINIIWNFINDFSYSWGRYSIYIFGTHRDPNYVSAFILASLSIVYYKIIVTKGMKFSRKIIFISLIAIITISTLVTGSRTAFMFTIIILVMNFIYNLINRKNSIINLPILLVFAFLLFNISKNIVPQEILMRLTNFESYTEDIRMTLWKQGFEVFERFPILGAGLGGLNVYLFNIGFFDSHNLYLDILCGQGLIGIILIAMLFKEFLRVQKKDKFLIFVLIISFFMPLSSINGFNTTTFWTPIILCQIFSNYSRANKDGLINVIREI